MTHLIRIYGIVQGVGFRPTVARHAAEYGINGTVSNKGPYVEVTASAAADKLEAFETAIRERSPRRAVILKMEVTEIPSAAFSAFSIIESEKTEGQILISPDIAICEECKRELYDKKGRRYLHPFINCTCCGPRLTILDALPYDRVRTSMQAFPMCGPCAEEYADPADRRYDAQPVCCNDCGPVVYLLGTEPDRAAQREAITYIRQTIADGGIVAIKGIGGYHLCCDATSSVAVSLLRARKKRPAKPFAVMMRDIEAVRRYCEVSPAEEALLTGHQKPIVLLPRKGEGIAPEVAPDNPRIGVMLPYAPIQLLLFDYDDALVMPDVLVMTSANTAGAPIVRDEQGAERELSAICDAILAHNRAIRVRADDTVVDLYRGAPYMIRRSRGYAPLPVVCHRIAEQGEGYAHHTVLAIGGELKNAVCVRVGDLAYLSPYIGDMDDMRTIEACRETVRRFLTLLEATPEAILCDMHPRYHSTELAEELAQEMQIPLYRLQHHYAHVLSCLAEQDEPGPVIGVSLDGTGYGEDGSIWGGELLIADASGYERAGYIRPFRQVGGDAAAREGWRVAVTMLCDLHQEQVAQGDTAAAHERTCEQAAALGICSVQEAETILRMADAGIRTVTSTSCGRLFDAVSAVLGIRRTSTYEGEASMSLQYAAERGRHKMQGVREETFSYGEEDGKWILDTDRLFAYIMEGRMAGRDIEELAYVFHEGLAEMITSACIGIRERTGLDRVVLTGGCYQNTLLLELTQSRLRANGLQVLRHHMIPPNDGGIALGQAVWRG